ncbi:MAG: rhomboid family intramembrane serine protease [Apibacter sp.]|uniref:rhomboid family intramembrane serine protease n=1 Tax=Apibacter sp. TaxID=2023709 RepID=UPI0025E65A4C|nr:rhomboid family intramembrane serine protease [Apibacter sp.]MCT6868913.1 rhomboid family intramembrane serine protease [Apibacter sp.]
MGNSNIIVIGIIVITSIISIKGFNDQEFFDRYKFNIRAILIDKQWDRMIVSAFLHGDIAHLFFNMYTFYFFSSLVLNYGTILFILTYFGSIIGGNTLALLMHKNNPYYSAIGASGGVSGILFASIILDSQISIGIFPLPFSIPGWIFGIIYLTYSLYGMKTQLGNIGHDAHLGGAIFGILCGLGFVFLFPNHFNPLYFLLMIIPLVYLVYTSFFNDKNK